MIRRPTIFKRSDTLLPYTTLFLSPFGICLIARLRAAVPESVVGMKDISGDPENLEALLKAFPGFRLYAGNETLLLRNMHLGGVACISAIAKIGRAHV